MSQTETSIITNQTFATIQSAVNKLVDLVRPTFGPASNKVIISKMTHAAVLDDGVQIARDFELPDPAENAVIRVIRSTAVKTNDRVGDGTTGALIMLQAIVNEVSRKRHFFGRAVELELKKGLAEAKEILLKNRRLITSKADLKKVALVSFDNEPVAEIISDIYASLGKEATITVDKSQTMATYLEKTDGLRLDRGYISPYMITNPERMEAVVEKPAILITDYRLTDVNDILPILTELTKKNKRELVIICDNLEQHALSTAIINRVQGKFLTVAINIPSTPDRKVLLEDLALLTGATFFSESKGNKLENALISDLGSADRFICRQDESIIVSPKGKKSEIAKAVSALREAVKHENSETKRAEIANRLGQFTNTLAVIKVGAVTDEEQKALKYKVEDAINAVKCAYKNGVVCGAGVALAAIKTSSPILNEALQYPARQIAENMGTNGDCVIDPNNVTNVVTNKTGPFLTVGVMDPVDVLIAGIESAVSIASILLTSSGMVVEAIKKPPVVSE